MPVHHLDSTLARLCTCKLVYRSALGPYNAYRAFIMKALDEGAEGKTVEWAATGTKFTGKVTPGKRFQDGKDVCRAAGIDSDSGDRRMRGEYTFCKDDRGGWQFKLPSGKGR